MKYLYLVQARDNIFPYKQALIVLFKMSNPNSITRIMIAILLASTTMAILFVGIPGNMNIAYAEDDVSYKGNTHQPYSLTASGTSIIDLTSQGFKATQGCGDEADGDATWCV